MPSPNEGQSAAIDLQKKTVCELDLIRRRDALRESTRHLCAKKEKTEGGIRRRRAENSTPTKCAAMSADLPAALLALNYECASSNVSAMDSIGGAVVKGRLGRRHVFERQQNEMKSALKGVSHKRATDRSSAKTICDCTEITISVFDDAAVLCGLGILSAAARANEAINELPKLRSLDICVRALSDEMRECLLGLDSLSVRGDLRCVKLKICSVKSSVCQLGALQALKSIDVSETSVTDEDVQGIARSRGITNIALKRCGRLTDIRSLASVQTLESLDVSGCFLLTEIGFLGALPALRLLDASATTVADSEIVELSRSRSLVKLSLEDCKVLRDVSSLASLAALEDLNLRGCKLLQNVGFLGDLPALRSLDLAELAVADEEIAGLGKSRSLVDVRLCKCRKLTDVSPLGNVATLRSVDLSCCENLSRVAALGRLPALQRLDLSGTAITDEDVAALCGIPTLVTLDLSGCKNITRIPAIASVSTLEVLKLEECDKLCSVESLDTYSVLRMFDASDSGIGDDSLKLLHGSELLRSVALNGCRTITSVAHIASIKTLEKVSLHSFSKKNVLGALGELPALRDLCISGSAVTDNDIKELSKSKSLVKISLYSCRAMTDVSPLASVNTLEWIELQWCNARFFGSLGKLPKLRYLGLAWTNVKDDDLQCLAECPALVEIDLHGAKNIRSVLPLASIKTLESICLNETEVSAGVGDLGRLPLLQFIDLEMTKITNDDIPGLGESQSLKKFNARWCRSINNLSPLLAVKTLEEIEWYGRGPIPKLELLGKMPLLRDLDLSGAEVSDNDVVGFGESRSLRKLKIAGSRAVTDLSPLSNVATLEEITAKYCENLFRVSLLGQLPMLRTLHLQDIAIDDGELNAICESKSLESIHLESCQKLSNASSLARLLTLQTIKLRSCYKLTDIGALGTLPVLKSVDLSFTPITDDALVSLGRSRSLECIDIFGCKNLTNACPLSSVANLEKLNMKWCSQLTRVHDLGQLPLLRELSLDETQISDDDIRGLSESRSLRQLGLLGCGNIADISPLVSVTTLESIDARRCARITKISALATLPKLKYIQCYEGGVSENEIESFNDLRAKLGLSKY